MNTQKVTLESFNEGVHNEKAEKLINKDNLYLKKYFTAIYFESSFCILNRQLLSSLKALYVFY